MAFSISGDYIDSENSQLSNRRCVRGDVHTIDYRDTPIEENYLCRVTRQVTITTYSQAPVLICFRGSGVMTVETYRNVVEL